MSRALAVVERALQEDCPTSVPLRLAHLALLQVSLSLTHSLTRSVSLARFLPFFPFGVCVLLLFLDASRSVGPPFKKKSNDDDGGDRCRSPSPHHPTHTHTHTRKKTKLTTGPAAAADGDGHDGSGGVGGPRPAGL